jgi:hypothetical protein
VLSVVASFCTATSSVCQRVGAQDTHVSGFDPWLVFRLARHPVWLLGFASMLVGFILQVVALHFGPLALVQPILGAELLFVFAYLAILGALHHGQRVRPRDWLAAVGMSAGISVFLAAAAPSGGRLHAPASLWWISGIVVGGCVLVAVLVAGRLSGPVPGTAPGQPADPGLGARRAVRRAAILGAATGVSWGFVAAVIKELSSHVGQGVGAVFGNWAVYVLMGAGAAAFLLVSHALAAGPLAASQPGFTIGDPATATLLGVFMFRESMRTTPGALAGEVLGLLFLVAGVAALSHSRLITGDDHPGLSGKVDGHVHPLARLTPRPHRHQPDNSK